jgi:peroxiredoxin
VGGARRRRELAGIIALFAAFALLARLVGGGLTRPPLPEARSPSLGKAPEFSLPTPGGEVHRLTDHAGQVVLLNFWALWCGPCREELPVLERLHGELRDEGLAIVAVNVDRGGAEDVQRFAEQKGLSFEILHDPEQRVATSYGVVGYPTTVVIDRAGRIVLSELGAWDWSHPDAVAWLRELISR